MLLFSPAFALAPLGRNDPGCPGAGRGLGVALKPRMFSFSNTIRSCSRARRVEVFSAQSLRRSVTFAVMRAMQGDPRNA